MFNIDFSKIDMKKENNLDIDIDYETACLHDTMEMLKLFDREIYLKISNTGIVARKLGGLFGVKEIQYYLAAFYANIGLLGVAQIVRNKDFLSREEKNTMKMHPTLSRDYMLKKELNLSAYLAYNHHEFPNGKGYYKQQKMALREAYLIHIADIFVGCLTHKNYRPAYSVYDARDWAVKSFINYPEFNEKEQKLISESLLKISLPELGIEV